MSRTNGVLMGAIELVPCHHCGEEAESKALMPWDDEWVIYCIGCGHELPFDIGKWTEDEAIEKWNNHVGLVDLR